MNFPWSALPAGFSAPRGLLEDPDEPITTGLLATASPPSPIPRGVWFGNQFVLPPVMYPMRVSAGSSPSTQSPLATSGTPSPLARATLGAGEMADAPTSVGVGPYIDLNLIPGTSPGEPGYQPSKPAPGPTFNIPQPTFGQALGAAGSFAGAMAGMPAVGQITGALSSIYDLRQVDEALKTITGNGLSGWEYFTAALNGALNPASGFIGPNANSIAKEHGGLNAQALKEAAKGGVLDPDQLYAENAKAAATAAAIAALKEQEAALKMSDEMLGIQAQPAKSEAEQAWEQSMALQQATGGTGGADGTGVDGGGNEASVICSELHRMGYLSDAIWEADTQTGREQDGDTIAGYHLWAKPVVRLMRRSRIAFVIARVLGSAWAHEMAARKSVPDARANVLGRILFAAGVPICRQIGRIMRALPAHGSYAAGAS